jgi:hypothetical protein
MSWDDFINIIDPNLIMSVCGGTIPTTYGEFCDRYEMYHDMPDLEESEDYSDSDGYDSVG